MKGRARKMKIYFKVNSSIIQNICILWKKQTRIHHGISLKILCLFYVYVLNILYQLLLFILAECSHTSCIGDLKRILRRKLQNTETTSFTTPLQHIIIIIIVITYTVQLCYCYYPFCASSFSFPTECKIVIFKRHTYVIPFMNTYQFIQP